MPLFLRLLIKHKIDAYALKSLGRDTVPVQVRPRAPKNRKMLLFLVIKAQYMRFFFYCVAGLGRSSGRNLTGFNTISVKMRFSYKIKLTRFFS